MTGLLIVIASIHLYYFEKRENKSNNHA